MNKLREKKPGTTRPNPGSPTRWGGVVDIYIWIGIHQQALDAYEEPNDCAVNDDGTSYNNHKLTDEDFLCAHQLAAILSPVKVLLSTLEAGNYPTSNLVKPYIGKMIDRLEPHKSTSTTYRGEKEVIKVNYGKEQF